MDESLGVTAWVNSVLSDHEGEGNVDAKISAVSMKLQIMSADLNDELEASMAELLAAAPRAANEVVHISKAVSSLQDELRALEARATATTRSSAEANVLLELERVAGHLSTCERTLVEAAEWDRSVRAVERLVASLGDGGDSAAWIGTAAAVAERLAAMAGSERTLGDMPGAEKRRAQLGGLRQALDAALKPRVALALKTQSGDTSEALRALVGLYSTLGNLPALEREYAATRPLALQMRWFATRSAEDDETKALAPWLAAFLDEAFEVALEEERTCHYVFGAHSARVVAILVVRETLGGQIRDSFAARLKAATQRAAAAGAVVDVAAAFGHAMRFVASLADTLADGDESGRLVRDDLALVLGGPDVFDVDYAHLELAYLKHRVEAVHLDEHFLIMQPPTEEDPVATMILISPAVVAARIGDVARATDAFFADLEGALARCGALSGGLEARGLVRATHEAARTCVERVSVALRALRAQCDGVANRASSDDTWAFADAGFRALELGGSLERRLRDHDDRIAQTVLRWCADLASRRQRSPAPAAAAATQSHHQYGAGRKKAPTLVGGGDDDHQGERASHPEARMDTAAAAVAAVVFVSRLRVDAAAARFVDDVVAGRAALEAPFERVGIERALDAVEHDAASLAFDFAFAPIRTRLEARLLAGNDDSSDFSTDTSVGAEGLEEGPSEWITAVGAHLFAALEHLDPYNDPANETRANDAAACRLGDASDGLEWTKLAEFLLHRAEEEVDGQPHGASFALDSGNRVALRALRLGDASVVSEATDAPARYDPTAGAKLATEWLIALASSTAACLLRTVLRLDRIDDGQARQLAADARYLSNVAKALDVPQHAVVLHLLDLAAPPTREALLADLDAKIHPETPARRLLEKIDAAFLALRV